jgi:hypothetical protein
MRDDNGISFEMYDYGDSRRLFLRAERVLWHIALCLGFLFYKVHFYAAWVLRGFGWVGVYRVHYLWNTTVWSSYSSNESI